jgi:hypothetical protein
MTPEQVLSDPRAFQHWCDVRKTSAEIGGAILSLAGSLPAAARIWAAPSERQRRDVLCRAWQKANSGCVRLFWCETIISRPAPGETSEQPEIGMG